MDFKDFCENQGLSMGRIQITIIGGSSDVIDIKDVEKLSELSGTRDLFDIDKVCSAYNGDCKIVVGFVSETQQCVGVVVAKNVDGIFRDCQSIYSARIVGKQLWGRPFDWVKYSFQRV